MLLSLIVTGHYKPVYVMDVALHRDDPQNTKGGKKSYHLISNTIAE